jgi:hypothetical protein
MQTNQVSDFLFLSRNSSLGDCGIFVLKGGASGLKTDDRE